MKRSAKEKIEPLKEPPKGDDDIQSIKLIRIWDLDETLIILSTLLTKQFGMAFGKDVSLGIDLGNKMMSLLMRLLYEHLCYEQLESHNVMNITEVTRPKPRKRYKTESTRIPAQEDKAGNQQQNHHHQYQEDAINKIKFPALYAKKQTQEQDRLLLTEETLENADQKGDKIYIVKEQSNDTKEVNEQQQQQQQQLHIQLQELQQQQQQHRQQQQQQSNGDEQGKTEELMKSEWYSEVEMYYEGHRHEKVLSAFTVKGQRAHQALYDAIDDFTSSWLITAYFILESTQKDQEVLDYLVTSTHLLGAYGKLLLFKLGTFFPIERIYSSSDCGKEKCFQHVKEKYKDNTEIVFEAIGDGEEECQVSKKMNFNFHRIQDLASLKSTYRATSKPK